MKAAVFHGPNKPLEIQDVAIDNPIGHEVLVRTLASGVCHSDVHFIEGLYHMRSPAILGHEAAGVVEAIGPNVTYVKPGDSIIACLSVFCGQCEACLSGHPNLCDDRPNRSRQEPPRLRIGDKVVTQAAGISGYAEMMLLHENGVVKLPEGVPMNSAALVGCGVTTGLGAVLNTARVRPGTTVAVFGAGGVGLAAIQGARIAGARQIIAVDMNDYKFSTALGLGATHTVDASTNNPVEAVRNLSNGGVDFAFEAIGKKATAEQAFESLRRGGTATIIGMVPEGETVAIDGRALLAEKRLQGSSMGSNRFRYDMPKYLELYMQGRLMLDEMVTRTGPLEDINEFVRAMKAGEVSRSVLVFDET